MSGAILNYIEVSNGVSLCIDDIEAVISNPDGLTSTVRTSWNSYQSTFPYGVLVALITRKEEPKRNEELNILKTLGHYAG